jgi:AcrR family transcriptional regulator
MAGRRSRLTYEPRKVEMTSPLTDTEAPTTRERILREAARLFAEKGFYGTSTREIAAAAEIRQPSVFHHFPTKDAIMLALIDINLDEPTSVAEREAQSDDPAALRLYRYLVWDLSFICRCEYDLTSAEPIMSDPAFANQYPRYERLVEARRRIIKDGIESGEFTDLDIDLVQKIIVWILRGDIADCRGTQPADVADTADKLASFALRALLEDPSRLDAIRAAAQV